MLFVYEFWNINEFKVQLGGGEWSGLLTLSNDGIYVVNGLVKTRLGTRWFASIK